MCTSRDTVGLTECGVLTGNVGASQLRVQPIVGLNLAAREFASRLIIFIAVLLSGFLWHNSEIDKLLAAQQKKRDAHGKLLNERKANESYVMPNSTICTQVKQRTT